MAKDKKSVPDKAAKRKYSRRDFLAVGGSALAGGALTIYPAKTTAAASKCSPRVSDPAKVSTEGLKIPRETSVEASGSVGKPATTGSCNGFWA